MCFGGGVVQFVQESSGCLPSCRLFFFIRSPSVEAFAFFSLLKLSAFFTLEAFTFFRCRSFYLSFAVQRFTFFAAAVVATVLEYSS